MKKLLIFARVLAVIFVIGVITDSAHAGKGNKDNGFPEGKHFNLNLIAKKTDPSEHSYFKCPSPDDYRWDYYMDAYEGADCTANKASTQACKKCDLDIKSDCPVQVLSAHNVVFVPRDNDVNNNEISDMDITIAIMSGSDRPGKRGKIKDIFPSLTVTDWCTEHFPDYGAVEGDEAVVNLPESSNGYAVYVRITGKPVEGIAWAFLSPTMEKVQDEYANDLFYFMGTIGGPDGCTDAKGNYIGDSHRVDTTKGKGKGVKQATDLTCLFEFTGQICYVNDLCHYCDKTLSLCEEGIFAGNDAGFICCEDTYEDDPVFDSCGKIAKSNCGNPVGISTSGESCNPNTDSDCEWTCPEVTYSIEPLCRDYQEQPTWVFNISDFVNVLWKSEGYGAYVIQLRFYPL